MTNQWIRSIRKTKHMKVINKNIRRVQILVCLISDWWRPLCVSAASTARWSTASSTVRRAASASPSPTTCTAAWRTWCSTTTRPPWCNTTTRSTCASLTPSTHRCPPDADEPHPGHAPPHHHTLTRTRNRPPSLGKEGGGGLVEIQTNHQTSWNTCCNTHVSHLGVLYFYKNIFRRAFFLKTAWFAQGSFKCLWMWKKKYVTERRKRVSGRPRCYLNSSSDQKLKPHEWRRKHNPPPKPLFVSCYFDSPPQTFYRLFLVNLFVYFEEVKSTVCPHRAESRNNVA